MTIFTSIRRFFQLYSTLLDRIFIAMVLISLLLGIFFINLNDTDFHYTTVLLFVTDVTPSSWMQAVLFLSFCGLFLFYGMYIRKESPRSSTFIWGLGLLSWCALSNLVLCYGIQSTPFPPIDEILVKMDRAIGIHTGALMAWTHNHPRIADVFKNVYSGLIVELLGIPLALTIFNARKSLGIFYIAQMSTNLIGCLIYYFFPTMAPSGIIHSPYFSHAQHDTSLRFYQIHHFIHATSTDGGMIAFPSFHVVWAILLTYACRGNKFFFYPVALYNLILIISTVMLGWHYAIDVIAGAILAAGGIAFGEWAYKQRPN